MRDRFSVAFAAAGLLLMTAAPAAAVGTRHPFCIQGNEYPGLSNCSYDSYAQCQATASGRLLSCIANPFFGGGESRVAPYPYPQPHRRARPPAPNPYAPLPNPFVFEED